MLSFLLLLLSFISLVHAWGFVEEFQQELQNEGLTQLATIVSTVNQTSTGQALFCQISQGNNNYTFFAPTDEAIQNFTNVSSQVSSNTTLLAEYLSYHFVHGDFQNVSYTNTSAGGASSSAPSSSTITSASSASSSAAAPSGTASLFGRLFGRESNNWLGSSSPPQLDSGVFPNTTLGRTLLNSSDLVMLPGNKSQVLAWTRSGENGNVTILNQISDIDASQNVTVVDATWWKNLFINQINGVLIPPGNISTALNATNATNTLNLLSNLQIPSSNGTNETALEFLQEAIGLTLFVPNDTAFTTEVNQTVTSYNQTSLTALLENHYINGTVLYSPLLMDLGENSTSPNATSAAGEALHFVTNSSGTFVEGSNGSGAQIVRPDVLIDNGVIHIIDRVLLNNESDPAAASSAYASATSAAASPTTETGPIGVTSTTASASSSGESSSAPSSTTESGSSASGGTVTVTASVTVST